MDEVQINEREEAIAAEKREHVVALASAYFSHTPVSADSIPNLLASMLTGVESLYQSRQSAVETPVRGDPAVEIDKSITPDAIICLEDGRSFKSLKRHLRSKYDMSPEEYRAKWGLAADYPMVAPNYAKARSELAKQMGLGQKGTTARGGRKAASASAGKASGRATRASASGGSKTQNEGKGDDASGTRGDARFPEGITSIGDTIKPDGLICLEDGEITKNLTRHLKTLDITPEDYRAKWGLSDEYPMTLQATKDFDFDKVKLEA